MRLRIFKSDQGECMLLSASDGTNILAGGGGARDFAAQLAPVLANVNSDGESLDVVYLSDVNASQITGVLKLLECETQWKVHDYQVGSGNFHCKTPKLRRPPAVKALWHNPIEQQLPEDTEELSSMLAYSASGLALRKESWALPIANSYAELATSEEVSVALRRQLGPRQLHIPRNPEYGGDLMVVMPPPDPISVGALEVTVVGPFQEDIEDLRRQWSKWLRTTSSKQQVASIPKRRSRDRRSEIDELLDPIFAFAKDLGDEEEVQLPPIASLKLLIEDGAHSALMCGTGGLQDVQVGLEVTDKMREDGTLHVNVLKMPSGEAGTLDFSKKITADHYAFCDASKVRLSTVQAILDSRLGNAAKKSETPEVDEPFEMWFNSSSATAPKSVREGMASIEKLVKQRVRTSKGRLKARFLSRGSSFTIEL